jgi:myo-inositol 2-dehydrogenase / D-chiro-inositol 1-dehydrogenase
MHFDRHPRRDFLKKGMGLAAAGMAAPYVFTGAKARAEESKNDRLTLAAIGVGGRGTHIGRQAAWLGNMVACADVNLSHAENFAARLKRKCQAYQDYRKALERKDVEAVTIGAPDHWHAKIAIDAMKAGKDVYCEKPLTLTIEESKLICRAVKETGRVFQVGTQQRSEYDKCFLEAVAIARSGRLGTKLKARASVGPGETGGPHKLDPPPKELNWDFWLGQAPQVPYCPNRNDFNFRWWFDYAGGQVTDWGVHHTDIALWALGGEETGIAAVEVSQSEFPLGRELTLDYLLGKKTLADLPNSYNVARSFDCIMHLPNGNKINLNSAGNDLYIIGEKGHLAVNRNGIRGKFVENLKKESAGREWLDKETAKLYRNKPFYIDENPKDPKTHMANFFDCVKDRSLPISDVFTHCNSVNACHTANIAMLLNRKVTWDHEKQEFVGDDEANQLTRRRQRKPYEIAI